MPSVMRTFTSSEEGQVLKTLSAVRITVAHIVVGVIIAQVALAGAVFLPGPEIYFYWSGLLHSA